MRNVRTLNEPRLVPAGYDFFFLHTLFQVGLTIAPIQNTGLINAKYNNTLPGKYNNALYGTINLLQYV